MKIYLIIIAIGLIHLVVFYFFKIKNSVVKLNSKLPKHILSKEDHFKVESLIKDNHQYNILIVEDDIVNRKMLKSQLKAANYNVLTAKNGKEALRSISENPDIDIVILDIILPDISGFEVCRKIRKEYTLYEKPVIMVTSKSYVKDLLDGYTAGTNDFVTKPYNIYELVARINSNIHLRRIFKDNTSLKKINKLKSDLVDIAAHDLKSPLTLISGYANRIAKQCPETSKETENARKIITSSNKMLSILNNLLVDSKFQSKTLRIEDIELVSLIESSLNFYSDMANNKNQQLIFKNNLDSLLVKSDRASIITILDNLITNAIKYSPMESIISVSLSENENDFNISVKDSGNGFTKEELDNLFVKFFPFKNKPTRGENSTGLGLYIIYDMVTRINGKISVNSELSKGSEFTITLPKEETYILHPIQ